MQDRLIIIRQSSHLRNVTSAEVQHAVPKDLLRLPRETIDVDMRPFANDVNNGYWDNSESYIVDQSREIRELVEAAANPVILYFGLAEIPHVIAMGAYVGDERQIRVYDYDRDVGTWEWPETKQTIKVFTKGLPTDRVEANGNAVIRVSVSYDIGNTDVDAIVSRSRLADITVRVDDPRPAIVRSSADTTAIRLEIRRALSKLRELRPRLDRIHLFVAAPVSVCFLLGQELRLRSGVPVVTYRFRIGVNGAKITEAIVLQAGGASLSGYPLTVEQRKEAATVRQSVWPKALRQVVHYASTQSQDNDSTAEHWYTPLLFGEELHKPNPFPPLPPLWKVVDDKMEVSTGFPSGGQLYGLPKTSWKWQLSDELLLGQRSAALRNGDSLDEALFYRLVRLFLFHECLHSYHAVTKYTAEDVGSFANCLERIDYMADLYAVFHELDHTIRYDSERRIDSGQERHKELKQILDNVLLSHWAFVNEPPVYRWQVRHVRRFLNWYWRLIQVVRAPNFKLALRVLSEPPVIEIAGFEHSVGGRRVYVHLDRLDRTTDLSLGLVTEKAQLLRVNHSVNTDLRALARALSYQDHEAIKTFFQAVFEVAEQTGGALPSGGTISR
ncbi:MAG: SAVED domain-containing protein [Bacteroidetes bacterium]|nr:SAVED domain-containing protein [Bacteroidota bacterium]